MSEIKHAKVLLDLAEKDLKALLGMHEPSIFAEEIFGFHAQQAIEKALKAWIAASGKEYPLTHNIARLLAILEKQGSDVERFWDLVEYNVFAVEFRYGSLDLSGESLNRREVIKRVQELLEYVRKPIADKEP
jgi:HEPN domain-containing protein